MSHKLIFLTFISYYVPGYKAGGQVQSVANIVDQLGDEFDFRVVTRDRDAGEEKPFSSILIGKWCNQGKGSALYLNSSSQSLRYIARIMRETTHDAIYLNSFFHFRSTILPLLAQRLGLAPRKPVIVAPRGEFSTGALGIKRSKKMAYIAIAKVLGLYRNVLWHASSVHEAKDIHVIFGATTRIHVASDLPRGIQNNLIHMPREPGQPLRVVFLSRISPMKNLKYALEILSRVKAPIDFTIIGPVSDQVYWSECRGLIESLPLNIRVSYDCIVPAPDVPKVMAQHDIFFLPTLGENFGHVIIEALGAGVPALISDQTPWQDFEAAGCGWVIPLSNVNAYVSRIEKLFAEKSKEALARRGAAIEYARKFSNESGIVDDNRALLLSVFQMG
jgi:glycosyltransferase involved in cell wall biosynthesis